MDLHSIVSGAVGAVNPFVPAVLKISNGYTIADDGKQIPDYLADATISAQVQPLTWTDLQQLDGLNIQGNRVAIYCSGDIDGLVRSRNKGGDLIVIATGVYAGVWLVVQVLEQWPNWTKCACTLQDGA